MRASTFARGREQPRKACNSAVFEFKKEIPAKRIELEGSEGRALSSFS
jgi:hypothetical protein